jgi:anti-sigma factor RsiW
MHAARLEERGVRERACPVADVVVAAHCGHRCDARELVEDRGVADVAGMHDEVAARERGHGLRAQEAVGVGDQPDPERHQAPGGSQ